MKKARGCEPTEYSKGFCRFLGCKIDLSFKPMIPRLETEFWVKKAIKRIKSQKSKVKSQSLKILDIFAGSGCIGISILKNIEKLCGWFIIICNFIKFETYILVYCKIFFSYLRNHRPGQL